MMVCLRWTQARLVGGRRVSNVGTVAGLDLLDSGRRVTHRRAQSGWPSLTPSERAVVDLVAEGLSNPQIGQRLYVSRRTVQTHLAHVFAKLDITSRTQLTAEAIRHQG